MKYFRLLSNLYKLKGNTVKTRAEIKNLQNKKLRKLLNYAYENSKYYRRTFEEAGITREQISTLPISAFPIIDKDLLMEHFDELVTNNDLKQNDIRRFDKEETVDQIKFKDKYHVVHSSGSTGKPGYFVYDEEAWDQMLLGIIRAAFWNMSMPEILKLLFKRPRIVYIAATDGRYGGAMAVSSGVEGVHANQLFLDIKTPIAEWIENLHKFKPNMIIGYPSAIKILGELLEKGEVQLKVSRVISCGEPLCGKLRDYIEKTFHADVVNIYGASESLALGVETNHEEGMYLFDDMNYIEVEDGTMYLTSLYNFAQPLIRYKISDQLVLKELDEKCIYPFNKVESILGRNEDIIWFEDKDGNREFLHPLAIEGFCVEGLLDYQFRQIDCNSFEMMIEVSDEEKKNSIQLGMLKNMAEILSTKHLEYVNFNIRFVEEILPDPQTGKKRLIVK
ncbi:phenylacetate--CoA ligase family protein [Clostridium estertheticum]|uniref:Phenylacetate--CoA ligase family protein n=1 Tax=Clostridium estertheticum TaxID=238834 RepID=A0A7Y3SZ28_9CLOT|nr:phenylacetate--CoA ligase family protein [Clostridium estertheticum]NNU77658.1 phenylacetate--CoA ligase family protein [Clostridium estertheticum]WBL48045.1 phenylacetate--CoA ligase family protein [Clostridium estertheticum]